MKLPVVLKGDKTIQMKKAKYFMFHGADDLL